MRRSLTGRREKRAASFQAGRIERSADPFLDTAHRCDWIRRQIFVANKQKLIWPLFADNRDSLSAAPNHLQNIASHDMRFRR